MFIRIYPEKYILKMNKHVKINKHEAYPNFAYLKLILHVVIYTQFSLLLKI